ncbi:hypothetical protein MGYG_05389 [Nannizzia gypsea CBS 118893]|uniref:Uncharacterized protein n=1 Tax=Arthroderma gypseum (strain ATCC MYA-4604 / CBS 118893) TaxID=535722 RepID=E4UVR6_ARTGP|nr:hypothetical protein MGYG_05389 [Nannizzia gypsea CBS 118893]EFR02393.1 hypothetical protein MGYG_05389 [Nannizzia gypsea CBS 118893]
MELKADDNFKWEESPGLYHGCGVCGTCLNSPKAKRACYGKHTEPCLRYHQTMFCIGNSHKCDPCRKSNDLHEKRHRDIAELVEKIHEFDRDGGRTVKFVRRIGGPDGPILTPRIPEMMLAKAAIMRSLGQTMSLKGTPSAKDRRAEKKAKKLEKSVAKSIKRQVGRATVPGIVLASSVEQVNQAIHGISKLESSLSPEDADTFFVASIKRFQELEQEAQETAAIKRDAHGGREKSASPGKEKAEYGNVNKYELPMIKEILDALNIRINNGNADKDRKQLLTKLGEAIFADLELVSNEARETMRRSAGYWRFANRRTYNAMVRNSKIVNWETGEKLTEETLPAHESEE